MFFDFLAALSLAVASLASNSAQDTPTPETVIGEVGENSSSKDESATEKERVKDVKTCRYSHVAGSRIPQRICMTQREWEDMETQHIEAMRSTKNRNSSCPDSGPC